MNQVMITKLCNIEIGKTPSRSDSTYWGTGVNWVSIRDMKEKYIFETNEEITTKAISNTGIKIVPKNTVIMSFKLSVGKVAITGKDLYTNEAIAAFHILDDSKLFFKYLYYALQTIRLSESTDRAVMGLTLNKQKLKQLSIPLPPIEIQKKIVEVLDRAQALIDTRKEQIRLMDEMIQSVFYKMFGDPVTNPKGWKVKNLEDISLVRSSKRVFVDEFVDHGIPFYRGTEVGILSTGENISSKYFISEEHYSQLKDSTGVPLKGDLLLPSICNDGRIWRVNTEEPFYFKDGRVLWIQLIDSNFDSIYLQYMLREKFINDYHNIASGTTFAELKIFALKSLEIFAAPCEIQEEFSQIVVRSEIEIKKMKESLLEIENTYKSLMFKAFSGELF